MTTAISAIVPAYNEALRIGAVLQVLTTYPGFAEVIVVDDGSTDATASVVKSHPVRYVGLRTNHGKGYAMDRGVAAAKGSIIFFCDADVRGLRPEIIRSILAPVVRGEQEMCIGMRNRKIYFLRFILRLIPLLGGERALTKQLWQRIPAYYKHRYRIEAALNFFAVHGGKGFSYRVFAGLSQTVKEEKMGVLKGSLARWQMIYDVVTAELHVRRLRRTQAKALATLRSRDLHPWIPRSAGSREGRGKAEA